MSWIDANLLPGEEVVFRAKNHWIMFLRSIFFFFVFLFFLLAAFSARKDESFVIIFLICLFCGVVSVIETLSTVLRFITDECAVTNKRFILKKGFIWRSTLESQLKRVEGFALKQSVIGRILGYGFIGVTTGGVEQIHGPIHNPIQFRKMVQHEISREQAGQ